MPLTPLFGFSPRLNEIRPPQRAGKPLGFFDQFTEALQTTSQIAQRQVGQERLEEQRQNFARNQATKARQFAASDREQEQAFKLKVGEIASDRDRAKAEAEGRIIPANAENIDAINLYASEDERNFAIRTDSQGNRFIDPGVWQQIQARRAQDQETELVPDPEFLDTISTSLKQAGITFNPMALLDPDGDGLTSPKAIAAFNTMLDQTIAVGGVVARLQANKLARGGSTSAAVTAKVDEQQFLADLLTASRITRVNADGTETAVNAEEKLIVARQLAHFRFNPDANVSAIDEETGRSVYAQLVQDYRVYPKVTAKEILDEDRTIITNAGAGGVKATEFVSSIALPVINRIGGVTEPRLRKFFSGADNINTDIVIADRVKNDPTFRKAMLLMSRVHDAEAFDEYVTNYGGYQEFTAVYGPEVINLMKELDPDSYGEINTGAVSFQSRTRAITGSLDNPVTDNTTPSDEIDGVENGLGPQQTAVRILEQAFTARMTQDPAASGEINDFLVALSDPGSSEETITKELDDILAISINAGIYSPGEQTEARQQIEFLKQYVIDNRELMTRVFVPLLLDAQARARINTGELTQ